MDTSAEYIKMCEKATQIQIGHKWVNGDVSYNKVAQYRCTCVACRPFFEQDLIWLPRQDQLQEMLMPSRYKENYDLASSFAANLIDMPDIMTFEQLWLGFVMKEKYGKTWDGETWTI